MDITKTREAFLDGQLLLIDKPLNWTSFQLVNKMRWAIRKTFDIKKIKVGHAGTLDPLATGLMIICTGRMTKQIEQFMGMDKSYTGVIRLGGNTPSYDLETTVRELRPFDHINKEQLMEARNSFIGTINQKPPLHSAIKKDGKRLYTLARAGQTIDIPAREIRINSFDLTNVTLPNISFEVSCSKGTYIRSLAHDYGQELGCGAHLASLCRTSIGKYLLSDSLSLEEFLYSLEEKS